MQTKRARVTLMQWLYFMVYDIPLKNNWFEKRNENDNILLNNSLVEIWNYFV